MSHWIGHDIDHGVTGHGLSHSLSHDLILWPTWMYRTSLTGTDKSLEVLSDTEIASRKLYPSKRCGSGRSDCGVKRDDMRSTIRGEGRNEE